jgi:hypothetical protein
MHRMLRLRDPLLATINSVQFKGIISKKKMLNAVSDMLLDTEFWKSLRIALRALFPPLRVLRLADKCSGGMDKLYYFVRKTDEAMQKSADDLDLMTYFTGRETDDEGDGDSDGDGGSDDDSDGDEIDLQEFADSDDEQQEEPEVGDQEQEGPDQDEEEADENDDASNSENLGDIFVSLWKKRRTKLVSDYAIAGWMLCPIKEVMEDMQSAQRDHTAEVRGGYILAVDRVIAKLFHENTAEELGVIKDTFWAEWQIFRGKTGPFYSCA